MTILGQLTDRPDMFTLGDAEGRNIGRVSEYNTIQLFFDSYIPFEQNCFFKFNFPQKLNLDEELTTIEGGGIFQPDTGRYTLNTDEF